jgi:mycofactocin precursor
MPESTSQTAIPAAPETGPEPEREQRTEDELIETELLVEEVSIDGMCGVY